MCIICDMPDAASATAASQFLDDFAASRKIMERAAASMLAVSKSSRRYDKAHKKMRRLIRDWNRIEQAETRSRFRDANGLGGASEATLSLSEEMIAAITRVAAIKGVSPESVLKRAIFTYTGKHDKPVRPPSTANVISLRPCD